jgi:hypothetical protein
LASKAKSLPTFLALHCGKLQPYKQVLKIAGKACQGQAVAYLASFSLCYFANDEKAN